MALPDPELEMLMELLSEDPGDEVFLLVGREFMVRCRWGDAVDVLDTGLEHNQDSLEGWSLLAEAALQAGQNLRALAALERTNFVVEKDQHLARLNVVVLEATGQLDRARLAAEAFMDLYPDDSTVRAVWERLDAPPPDQKRRDEEPLVSVERAESYVALGRADRAIRIYRRLAYRYPTDISIASRLAELRGQPYLPPDDLSEELTAEVPKPKGPPPDLDMPMPLLGLVSEGTVSKTAFYDEVTDPKINIDKVKQRLKKTGKTKVRPEAEAGLDADFGSPWGDHSDFDDVPTNVVPVEPPPDGKKG